ncbi:PhzF family phenazine biosynthesis protein [Mycobacterium sp. Aquia_216]|uniref:PhzF family phenazine biosynthesis protein n=1 Tax=Mycobacterium sp. Aquia_216 TaxID=2991729 RepID=UPI00227C8076|nr:PhzF family phenazine biosynthesis protein [Mycobacterium sp. Aquia_216]WAJ43746.1 PhzF family phenazine biosynthesis protein [Mycobacterium sp. Aquia_216]
MRIFTVDTFADQLFAGNPTAVCLLDSGWPPTEWLQRLASELNLPASAFVYRTGANTALRWFSPRSELELCGSGTLAAAHILWEVGDCSETLLFTTAGGLLGAQREPGERITLDFPSDNLRPVSAPPGLAAMLGVTPLAVWRGRLDLLAELDGAQSVAVLKPDLEALAELDARGVIVTARGDADVDFVSRFFAPAAGINEDPVAASAHCSLGAFWSTILGKQTLTGSQLSARGGRVEVRLRDDRVNLTGQAVTVIRGALAIQRAT